MTVRERHSNLTDSLKALLERATFHKQQFEACTAEALKVQGALEFATTIINEENPQEMQAEESPPVEPVAVEA